MSLLFENANDTEKEVANILLELSSLVINKPAVPGCTAPPPHCSPDQFSLIPTADHRVASQLETSSCRGESYDEKSVPDDQRIPFIEENYSSEIKAERTTPPCIPKVKVKKIIIKPPRPEKSPQVCYADQPKQIINDEPSSPKEDVYPAVMVMKSKKKTPVKRAKEEFEEGMTELAVPEGRLVGGSRKAKAEPTRVLEANPFTPHKKPANRKWQQEMENEVVFWEHNKRDLLESIDKVKDFLEMKKDLNLQLKALRKLQLSSSSSKVKSDSG